MANESDRQTPLTSTELGNLWTTYQSKTLLCRMLEHFLEHPSDEEADRQLSGHHDRAMVTTAGLEALFRAEGAAVPQGFTREDLYTGMPRLFDEVFSLMFLRLMATIHMGLCALYMSMSYRTDIRELFQGLTTESQRTYDQVTRLLLERGQLAPPPTLTMPRSIEFVEDKSYMTGMHLFSEKRALNTIEVGQLHRAVESNITGMNMMAGFAQAARDPEVRAYFVRGGELASRIIRKLSGVLQDSGIQTPGMGTGRATDSTIPPFSDKLMMYCTNLLSIFGLGSNAIGSAFSLRSDLPPVMALISKDIFAFSKDGGLLMVKNGWMEEPPQMEDRRELAKQH